MSQTRTLTLTLPTNRNQSKPASAPSDRDWERALTKSFRKDSFWLDRKSKAKSQRLAREEKSRRTMPISDALSQKWEGLRSSRVVRATCLRWQESVTTMKNRCSVNARKTSSALAREKHLCTLASLKPTNNLSMNSLWTRNRDLNSSLRWTLTWRVLSGMCTPRSNLSSSNKHLPQWSLLVNESIDKL